ncbi:MAG TPA: cbb3-type cytochrome c oxidase subunit II [Acidimicrobiia bacterium]|nr:cbb3-type cytochrome c oxidase subunit II [Acidimicrobiia bacterium]
MSDLSEAAAALGVPEALVERSAAARAAETGASVDEVLAAWAAGGDVPASVPSETPPAPTETSDAEEVVEGTASDTEAPAEETAAPPPTAGESPPPAEQLLTPGPVGAPTTVSGKPPVLVGEADNPIGVLVGAVALFVAIFLVGLVGPALPAENPGARTSDLPYTEAAVRGQEIYRSVGCASCHTQMVRPVVADVDLGAVTLNDSNQVLGTRRFGPDLSNVGARVPGSQIEALVTGLGDHPSIALAPDDLAALVAYLLESRTLEGSAAAGNAGGEEPAAEEPAES